MFSRIAWPTDAGLKRLLILLACLGTAGFIGHFAEWLELSLFLNAMELLLFLGVASICLAVGWAIFAHILKRSELRLSDRAWTVDSVLALLLRLIACFMVVGLSSYLVDRHWDIASAERKQIVISVSGTLFFQVALLFLIRSFLQENQLGWSSAFGFRCPGAWKGIALGVCLAAVLLPVNVGLIWLSQKGMEWWSIQPVVQQTIETLRMNTGLHDRLFMGVLAIVMAPLSEELLFRGILYPAIKQAGLPNLALWGTAILFALTHANMMTFLPLTLLALTLTLLYEHTGNLLAPIVTHSLFNAANFAWVLLEPQTR